MISVGTNFDTGGDRARRRREQLKEFGGSSDGCKRKRDQKDLKGMRQNER
jgi:hypothetical protein